MTDRYDWELSRSAIRDLEQLPEKIAAAVVEFIDATLVENPERLGGPLRDRWAGHLACRRGDFRIVYRVERDRRLVLVARIRHRGNVYHQ